jgi:hypothetical protein
MASGPSLVNETDKIPREAPTLDRLFPHGDPITGIFKAGTIGELLALIAGVVPTITYADLATMLANTTIVSGFFAFVSTDSDGWAIYLYTGGTRSDISSYRLVAAEGNAVTISPTSGIALEFNSRKTRDFITTVNIATPKTVTELNDTAATKFTYTFPISDVAGVLTLPSTYKMNDIRKSGNDWTPDIVGQFVMEGKRAANGTDWNVVISGPYA